MAAKGQILSFLAGTTIPAARIVKMDTATANRVLLCSAVTEAPIGITIDTVLETNLAIPVQIDGVAKLEMGDSVGSGLLVESNSLGKGVVHTALSTGSYVIGTLIGPKVEVTGSMADVLIRPQRLTID